MKAIFINGSPRKNKNTAQMLEAAMRGAQEAGAEIEMIHLYSLNYQGCKSCFACKLKGNKVNGLCAIKDELQPILEKPLMPMSLLSAHPCTTRSLPAWRVHLLSDLSSLPSIIATTRLRRYASPSNALVSTP